MLYSQSSPITNDPGSEVLEARFPLAEVSSLAPTLFTISLISFAMTVTGCARNPGQRDFNPARHEVNTGSVLTRAGTHKYFAPRRYGELRIHMPDAALLAPQPAPDCDFKEADVEAMDAAELKRLKLEYERRCYQSAEKAVRERLRLLQASIVHMRDDLAQHRKSLR
jgi:hypothetical protein